MACTSASSPAIVMYPVCPVSLFLRRLPGRKQQSEFPNGQSQSYQGPRNWPTCATTLVRTSRAVREPCCGCSSTTTGKAPAGYAVCMRRRRLHGKLARSYSQTSWPRLWLCRLMPREAAGIYDFKLLVVAAKPGTRDRCNFRAVEVAALLPHNAERAAGNRRQRPTSCGGPPLLGSSLDRIESQKAENAARLVPPTSLFCHRPRCS